MKKWGQLARLPNVLLLFVQRNSRKRRPWNYSLTCRSVLIQLLVPKTTRENGENHRRLTRRPLPQNQDQVQVSANAAIGYGLSCLTDRSDRHKNIPLTANRNSLTCSGKTELTTSYIQQGNA